MALAPAKLNLWLDVLGRRPDGYHELESLFVALDWGDEVRVEPRAQPGVELELAGEAAGVPATGENLAVRAAAAWLEALGAQAPVRGVRIVLEKRVPAGGGLGGGSSDAACVLRQLQALCGPGAGLGPEALARVALGLGSDVPFFLLPARAALGRGRGERLEPVHAVAPRHVVLVTPPWPHATAQVFAHAAERLRRPEGLTLARACAALAGGPAAGLRAAHWNALALPARRAAPAFTRFTSEVERRLGRAPALTGSGSTLYDVVDDADEAGRQARALQGLGRVVVARMG
ncbi:MAG: 4-(cytidine 5'-diphospho)-2-C-methyl-D-erythritol kinase [Planctomycetia bacterium]